MEQHIVVSDTEPTNTGHKNGEATQLQKEYPGLRYEPCQLHDVLDLISKHAFSAHFSEQTASTYLPYDFVQDMVRNWKQK